MAAPIYCVERRVGDKALQMEIEKHPDIEGKFSVCRTYLTYHGRASSGRLDDISDTRGRVRAFASFDEAKAYVTEELDRWCGVKAAKDETRHGNRSAKVEVKVYRSQRIGDDDA